MVATMSGNGCVTFGIGASGQCDNECKVNNEREGKRLGLCGEHVEYMTGMRKTRRGGDLEDCDY